MIKRTIKTHYYELDWSEDYGETREKIYLAIRGKIEKYSFLDLSVRNVSYSWHETPNARIKEINKRTFFKNATSKNIARFCGMLPDENTLLNYPKKLMESFKQYEPYFEDRIKKYKSENKSSIKLELEKLKNSANNKTLLNRKKEKEWYVR